jgi:virulence factor Mce-like protein
MNRRRSTSLAGSPLLIGAVTTLIAVVAVYLSYNANNGLPFTPTYDINVQLPQASGLQAGNQVRIGGTRVGLVGSLTPHQDPATGLVTAIVHLKLEKSVQPLPADTTAIVQSVSAIGLKYLSLAKGSSSQTLKPGATIPMSHTREPVDIDQLFNMFDKRTRTANQQNLTNFGNGLAGRGIGLNETLAELRPLVERAIPVLRNLASPQTGFRELFVALDRAASEVAPVAGAQAGFYSNLDTFFAAWASVAPSLEEAIEEGPAALRQATHSLPFEAPFIEKGTEFMRLLRPGARALRSAAGSLGHAFAAGAVNLRAAVALNGEIAEASKALGSFAQNPIVQSALEDLTHTLTLGSPLVAGLAPVQTNCNYATLAFRNIASLLSESIGVGTVARAAAVLSPVGGVESPGGRFQLDPNSEGLPSSAPADGPSFDRAAAPSSGALGERIDENHLHVNPYPNVGGPGQPHVCEAGNEPYLVGKAVIGNVPAKVSAAHEKTARKQNLFGETYPSQALSDLGLTHQSKKGKHK